ncbi:MAG: Ppx/GppA family phosphatase [SAR324 cluster bacterium]|nr:Ppx/GppA family phosphatase [SAR324 cluster bacterium]
MKAVGVIDVGSNAVRMRCAHLTKDHRVEPIESSRTPIRLGGDVFNTGEISEENIEKLIDAFKIYHKVFKQNECEEIRAYATSAFREAANQDQVIELLEKETGILLDIISGGKEAQILKLAILNTVDLEKGSFLLADLGGGSLEISLITDGEIFFAESYRLGTVRLLQMFNYTPKKEKKFIQLVKTYINEFLRFLGPILLKTPVETLVITGGNAASLVPLAKLLGCGKSKLNTTTSYLHGKDLRQVQKELFARTYQQRIDNLGLQPDRSDVIVPAICVFSELLELSKCKELVIPDVGLREGILCEISEEFYPMKLITEYEQIIHSAYHYAEKYQASHEHAKSVRSLSTQIFQGTAGLHHYGQRERILLEVAAILHDTGRFIRLSDHHKHSMYLIQNSELVGITNQERSLIGLIARYHSRSIPNEKHLEYARISEENKKIVNHLTAILRLADALDREHQRGVQSVITHYSDDKILLFIDGTYDLLLIRWAVEKKKDLFEQVFQKELVIRYQTETNSESLETVAT